MKGYCASSMSVRPFVCSRKAFEELSCERRTGLHVGLFVQLRHGIVSHSVELCLACPLKTNSENNEGGGASGFAVRRRRIDQRRKVLQ